MIYTSHCDTIDSDDVKSVTDLPSEALDLVVQGGDISCEEYNII